MGLEVRSGSARASVAAPVRTRPEKRDAARRIEETDLLDISFVPVIFGLQH